MRILKMIFALCLGSLAACTAHAGAPQTPPPQPTLYANGWTFLLVPSLEGQKNGNGLDVNGLNQSLRLGQLLNTLSAGLQSSLRQVYAVSTDKTDMRPLESVQPFALLNNLPLNVQGLDPSSYNNPAWFIDNLMGYQQPGIYVIGAAPELMPALIAALGAPAITAPTDTPYYVVASGAALPLRASAYATGLIPDTRYPDIALPPLLPSCGAQTKFSVPAPQGLKAYANQSVYFVRHVEAHPTANFENGNYVCQGQWRALGSTEILLRKMGGQRPDYVFTSSPNAPIGGCDQPCSYVRPTLTVAPFATRNDMALSLASFPWSGYQDLATSLFDASSPLFPHTKDGARILVGWEHGNIEKAVKYLVGTVYQNPAKAKDIPAWNYQDYDTIWKLETDVRGNLTFSNDCEQIPTPALPSTCPAFFQ